MDHSAHSATIFDKLADRYRDKFMDLTQYYESYQQFLELLPSGRARVLDAACGPGNVSRYLMTQRPDLDLLGTDLAPRMVELAQEAVPSARFVVQDLRGLSELKGQFDGIICAFGLPYLSWEETLDFIKAASEALAPVGVLYLSTMLGPGQESGFQRCSSGDEVYVHYHSEPQLIESLARQGFSILKQTHMPSPSAAAKATTDLILIARK